MTWVNIAIATYERNNKYKWYIDNNMVTKKQGVSGAITCTLSSNAVSLCYTKISTGIWLCDWQNCHCWWKQSVRNKFVIKLRTSYLIQHFLYICDHSRYLDNFFYKFYYYYTMVPILSILIHKLNLIKLFWQTDRLAAISTSDRFDTIVIFPLKKT